MHDYKDFIAGKPEKDSSTRGAESVAQEFVRGGYDRAGGVLSRLKGSGEEVTAIDSIFEAKKTKQRYFSETRPWSKLPCHLRWRNTATSIFLPMAYSMTRCRP